MVKISELEMAMDFKSFLEEKGLLDKLHTYEQEAQTRAIKDWCDENNIEYSI